MYMMLWRWFLTTPTNPRVFNSFFGVREVPWMNWQSFLTIRTTPGTLANPRAKSINHILRGPNLFILPPPYQSSGSIYYKIGLNFRKCNEIVLQ
uniref:Uncharacterized protein n=1 Tax=Lepeophtheirus salmonis TaxID=72036 RepID=A0A0K2T458_LEPSM